MQTKRNDVCADLCTLIDLEDDTIAEKVITLILNTSKMICPTRYDFYQPEKRKISESALDDIIAVWTNRDNKRKLDSLGYGMGQLLMKCGRKKNDGASYMVSWQKSDMRQISSIAMFSYPAVLQDKSVLEEFIQLWINIATIVKPIYGQISNCLYETQWQARNFKLRLPEIPWMMLLGKPYIDLFGRDKVLSTPCYAVHTINDDLIALQMTDDLFAGDIPFDVRQNVKEHLGSMAFVENGKNVRNYKMPGMVPKLDYSNVIFKKSTH